MIDAASNLVKVFLVHPSKAECLPLVAALAVVEVVAAEGAPVVVAGHAGLRAARAEVLRGPRRRDLSALTRAREHAVALVAAEALTRAVLRVAETDRVGARARRRAPVAALRVAGGAGRDVARGAARSRRVTAVAVVVRGRPGGYRERDAAPRGAVAGGAALLGAAAARHVARVVETHVEGGQSGERLHRRVRAFEVRVAVGAERAGVGEELLDVTVVARLVPRHPRARGVVLAPVARVAGQLGVTLYRVRELGRAAPLRGRRGRGC